MAVCFVLADTETKKTISSLLSSQGIHPSPRPPPPPLVPLFRIVTTFSFYLPLPLLLLFLHLPIVREEYKKKQELAKASQKVMYTGERHHS